MLPALHALDDSALRQLEANRSLSDGEWRTVIAELARRSNLPPTPRVRATLVLCPRCGHKVAIAAAACPGCGYPIAPPRRAVGAAGTMGLEPPPRRGVAIMLALLLGGVGAHKFYMNQPGLGVLYLLFFWTFIPALIALVEGIIYLCTSDEEWRERFAAA